MNELIKEVNAKIKEVSSQRSLSEREAEELLSLGELFQLAGESSPKDFSSFEDFLNKRIISNQALTTADREAVVASQEALYLLAYFFEQERAL